MTKTIKEPLVKISKRQNLALGYKLLLTVGAIVLSLIIGGILLACLGYNPVNFYIQMLMGNFKNASYLKLMVRALIPLLITSLGVSLAFKMRFWNIGAEGQFIVGALVAMTFSLLIGDSLPSPLGAIIIVLLGTLGGGLYAVFVAVLKVRFGTNETLMTLMLNYVALYIASYTLKTDFFAVQGQGVPAFKIIAESLWLTEIDIGKFSFDSALFVAVALVIIIFLYFKHSKHGYELNVVGDSPNTAKYAGMKVKWIVIRTMFLSGAIIGMAGALKLCGSSAGHTFSANITGGVGWTSIIVAWLAKLNPIGIFVASLLMSILERGCAFARTSLGISDAMSDVLQGVILFTVLASDFFINYKVSFRKKIKESRSEDVNTTDNATGVTSAFDETNAAPTSEETDVTENVQDQSAYACDTVGSVSFVDTGSEITEAPEEVAENSRETSDSSQDEVGQVPDVKAVSPEKENENGSKKEVAAPVAPKAVKTTKKAATKSSSGAKKNTGKTTSKFSSGKSKTTDSVKSAKKTTSGTAAKSGTKKSAAKTSANTKNSKGVNKNE